MYIWEAPTLCGLQAKKMSIKHGCTQDMYYDLNSNQQNNNVVYFSAKKKTM